MPTYMGNVGHLMQHWTLCKLLSIAADEDKHIPGLYFIDAHSMAPLARVRRQRNVQFDRVRDRLPGQGSAYEWAWHHLAPNVGYPNSAVFVEKVWQRDFALLLCETDWLTIAELAQWYESVSRLRRCRTAELSPGDWRNRFARPLPGPAAVDLPDGSLTLVSFDPDWYDYTTTFAVQGNGRKIYQDDLQGRVLPALQGIEGGILVHLPTYTVPNGGALANVIAAVDPLMAQGGFIRPCGGVQIPNNNRMMSLIYARNVPWADANVPRENELANLPADFTAWLDGI